MTDTTIVDTGLGDADDDFDELVQFDESDLLFTRPSDPRTEDYITGRVG